jgi:hypothetical protein
MSVSRDILRSWRHPATVMRELLASGQREDRALAFLMAACLLIFLAQWPRLVRLSEGFELPAGQVRPELDQLIAYAFLGSLIIWPLLFYLLAALSHLVARLLGGAGTWYGARLALFWALLASAPMILFYGLLAGFNGPTVATNLIGLAWCGGFLVIWMQGLRVAESARDD